MYVKECIERIVNSKILLEGVADRDWGIAFSVVNGRINKGICFSDLFILQK
jgi:hypothetical protein